MATSHLSGLDARFADARELKAPAEVLFVPLWGSHIQHNEAHHESVEEFRKACERHERATRAPADSATLT